LLRYDLCDLALRVLASTGLRIAAAVHQGPVTILPKFPSFWSAEVARVWEEKVVSRRHKRVETRTVTTHSRGMPPEQRGLANDHGRAPLHSRRRPPSYPSRLHNAWTASSRSTRPAVHARFDPWSCLQGCGRAADAKRLHAAQLSAAAKGCPDPAALSRGSPRSARGDPRRTSY
jgi:hypothetical protein